MRIKRAIPCNSTRKIKRFAFLPVTINYETRWLEMVAIYQVYRPDLKLFGWYNEAFAD